MTPRNLSRDLSLHTHSPAFCLHRQHTAEWLSSFQSGLLSNFLQERFAKKSEADDLRRAFDKLDSKGDGKIDAEEIAAMFNKLGHKAKRVSEHNWWRCKPLGARRVACFIRSSTRAWKRGECGAIC